VIYGSHPFFSEKNLEQITDEIKSVLRSGRLTDGPQVAAFEKEFAVYTGIKYAIATNSGSGSLDIALRHFKLNGREVIVPTNTFVSTPNAVISAGGKPVFVDMNPQTLGIDFEDVKRRVTPKTAGVIVVHIAGLVCPQIWELKAFCEERGLFLVEDCAHAHGAMLDGKKAGTFGDVGCFSFYPTKVMTSCEGGMVISDDAQLAEEARILRTCGQNTSRQMVMMGQNWRLNEVAAVIGRSQLAHLEEFLTKRSEVAEWYKEVLSGIEGLSLYKVPQNSRCSYYKYPTFLPKGLDRTEISTMMMEKFGIETGHVYFPPCHLHPYYRETYGTKLGDFPTAESVLTHVLCLPIHVEVTKEDIFYIRDSLVSSIGAADF
jgi:dTDP-4-amino-4,6-dideoxygalactose transaminase